MDRENIRQVRNIPTQFTTREEDEKLIIEGYFAIFNSDYEISPSMSESIAPGAFDDTLDNDIRALVNHDTTLVLGRTKAETLTLRQDDKGLWGQIIVNPKDVDATNLYSRVQRGDVNQCSFGFNILDEEPITREDGGVHWLMKKLDVHEVSCCTFPAYSETNIQAREEQRANLLYRERMLWREKMKERLNNGVKSIDAQEENN